MTALDAAPAEQDGAAEDEWTENRPPRRGLPRLELREAWAHRDLGVVLAQRTLKVRYRQTLLGVAWALLQPLAGLVIFTIAFGRLAKLPSDGLPYAVFVYPAMCLWIYVSTSVSAAAAELPQNPHLVTRVYFPRILSPAAAVLPGLVDFAVALALTPILLVVYDVAPGPQVLLVPAVDRRGGGRRVRRRHLARGDQRQVPRCAVRPALPPADVVLPESDGVPVVARE